MKMNPWVFTFFFFFYKWNYESVGIVLIHHNSSHTLLLYISDAIRHWSENILRPESLTNNYTYTGLITRRVENFHKVKCNKKKTCPNLYMRIRDHTVCLIIWDFYLMYLKKKEISWMFFFPLIAMHVFLRGYKS